MRWGSEAAQRAALRAGGCIASGVQIPSPPFFARDNDERSEESLEWKTTWRDLNEASRAQRTAQRERARLDVVHIPSPPFLEQTISRVEGTARFSSGSTTARCLTPIITPRKPSTRSSCPRLAVRARTARVLTSSGTLDHADPFQSHPIPRSPADSFARTLAHSPLARIAAALARVGSSRRQHAPWVDCVWRGDSRMHPLESSS